MKLFTNSDASDAKLGVMEIGAYTCGNIGVALINTIISSFLLFFYTDVMYLNPATLGILMLVSRLFDGVTDIFMGMIVDRTHSKYGRGRAWVLWMCLPYAVSGILLMMVPGGATEIIQYIYVFITYNLCNAICLTAVYVPYNAMAVNITSNSKDRGIISVFVMIGAVIGTMIVQSTVDVATKALGGGANAWRIVITFYAVAGLIFHLICFFGTKERCVDLPTEDFKKEKLDTKKELGALFKNKYWILCVIVTFFALLGTGCLGGAGMYYAKGVLGDTAYYASMANVMSVVQLISLFIAISIARKIGKKRCMIIGAILVAGACFLQGILPASLTLAVAMCAVKGVGAGLVGAQLYAIIADTIDYGEWKFGQKSEGVGMAAMTFATKIAQGISTVLIGWILDLGGYSAAVEEQSNSAVFAVNTAFNFLPAVCYGLAVVLLVFYTLDKQMPQIEAELKERRLAK